jgi:hypothetical protein
MNRVLTEAPDNGQRWVESAEKARDLKQQLAGLGGDDEGEIQFIEWSPGRRMVSLWNMVTGEEVTLPRYQALAALNTPNPRGGWLWTADKNLAPEPRLNSVKCFLHPEAPERELLDEIGITQVCMSGQLANESSKRKHARRHAAAWEQYQEEIQRRERAAEKAAQAKQTDAILSLASKKGSG